MRKLLDEPRLLFGFLLFMIVAALAFIIALGRVTEQESYGLMPLVSTLSTLAGIWAGWAFRAEDKPKDKA